MFFSWFVSGYAKDFPGTLSGTRSGKTRAGVPEPMNPRKQKRWGFPERRLHGKPHLNECLRRRVTLPHPAGCSTITVPGLSFRVRKGTGRHTWAMATAKTTTDGPDPQNRDPDRPKKTTHAPPPARAVTVREPDSGREHRFVTTGTTLLVANNPAAAKTRTHPHTQEGEWAAMSPSPVSTGRLHPSRGFHLRPIKHVFNMRATGSRRSMES